MLGRVLSIEEIKQLKNGFGGDAWYNCGGWNCRHRWEAVVEEEIKGKETEVKPIKMNYDEFNAHWEELDSRLWNIPKTKYQKEIFPKDHKTVWTELGKTNPSTYKSLDYYTENGHTQINANLRKNIFDEDYENIHKGDLKYIVPENVTVYRGMKFLDKDEGHVVLQNVLNNTIFNELMSTTLNYRVAFKNFGYYSDTENYSSIIFKAEIKKGMKVGIGTGYEEELILDKGTEYRIKDVQKIILENEIEKTILDIELTTKEDKND